MPGEPIIPRRSSFILILFSLLIAACGNTARQALVLQQPNAEATQAAYFVETEIARPTRTVTPVVTPSATSTQTPAPATPTPPQTLNGTGTVPADSTPVDPAIHVTPQPGFMFYTNPDIPDYVFQINPDHWRKDPIGNSGNLVHKTIMGCGIDSVSGHGLAAPKRLLWQDFGRFRWEIMDYGPNAYTVPVSGSGIGAGQANSFLNLRGYNLPDCRKEQGDVLANLMTRREASGELPLALFQSPTPRPALEGFSCPNTPQARLRIGDQVSVVTDGLWLRSAPQADESSKIQKLLRNAPFNIRVVDGPVCEKYVYWKVEVSTFGEGSETKQGWLAEGDTNEYYLMTVK